MNKTETKNFINTVVQNRLNTRTKTLDLRDRRQAKVDVLIAEYLREQGLDPAVVSKVFKNTSAYVDGAYISRPELQELPEAYKQRLLDIVRESRAEIRKLDNERENAELALADVLAGLKTDAKIAKAFPEFAHLLPTKTSGALMDPNAVDKVRKTLGLFYAEPNKEKACEST